MIVDEPLVRRVERAAADDVAAIAEPLARLAPSLQPIASPLAGGQVVLLGRGMYVNRGVGMGMGCPLTDEHLDTLEELSAAVDVAPQLEVCPWADSSLLDVAGARGYRAAWFRSTLLFGLDDASRTMSSVLLTVEPVTVEPVTDEDGLTRWQGAAASGFGYTSDEQRATSDLFSAAVSQVDAERLYLAHIDGDLVGVAALTIGDGVATLGGMTTLPEARRRGVQRELVRHRLGVAADAGCDLATTTAVPGGDSERNLLRCGFSLAYTKVALERQ